MKAVEKEHLLGRGIYDVVEIAHLVQWTPAEVSRWAHVDHPLLLPINERLFSFYDLITAWVTAELRRRAVPLESIRDARRFLAKELEVDWPLAHAAGLDRLASVGNGVYYKADAVGWLDASAEGQLPFEEVARPLRQHLTFNEAHMATSWRPAEGILLDPRVQAGAPCVAGTRITTQMLASLVSAGDDPRDIAEDYDVDATVVEQAVSYEDGLAA